MNKVQEMLRLTSRDKLEEAVARLTGLFTTMSRQPGFLSAEVLRSVILPDELLILHAWRDLTDWQCFQTSEWKLRFSAERPESLYEFLPCGMNWRTLEADGDREGHFLRREVIRGETPLRTGEGVLGCRTYAYQDSEPDYLGCFLRLTRLAAATQIDSPDDRALADEVYESLTAMSSRHVLSARPTSPA